MTTAQGDVTLLEDPTARALLGSNQLARLAYTWVDGTPRVVPIWFHWTGELLVFGTPPRAPKVEALRERSDVAVTIDDSSVWPYRALLLRGRVSAELLEDVVPEYVEAAGKYFGPEQGEAWAASLRGQPMARITLKPSWVAVLDFETRFPSAMNAER